MRWLGSARQRWWLLAAAWLALLILGIGGFIQQANDLGMSTTFLDNLYFTLQLAALDFQGESEEINWRLQIARFVAPIIAASTLLQSASVVFREQFARFRARRARHHTVVCGLGPVGTLLCGALVDDRQRVVAIEADSSAPGVATATDLGVPVIIGDPTDAAVLRSARADRATRLVAVGGSDAVDAAIAAAARSVERGTGLAPLRCAVHLTDTDLAALLRSTELTGTSGPRIEFFNLHERAASTVLAEHPLPAGADGDAPGTPHLVVMGLGQFGRNVVLTAARQHALAVGGRLAITLVDRLAEARYHALRMQHPALTDAVDATCIDLDLGAPTADAVDQFEDVLRHHPPSLVIVAFEDESLAWTSGLFVRNRLANSAATIVIRTSSDGGLAGLLDVAGAASARNARVATFPLVARSCSLDLIDGGVREQLARSIHEGHLARTGSATAGTAPRLHQRWPDLSDDERESSRRAADAMLEQLHAIGCEPVPMRRWGSSDRVLTDDEVDRIAATEHARWKAEREGTGWTYGPVRDDTAKHNPLLVAWADLDPTAQEQNRAGVAELSTSLARAGFEIQRLA